MKRCIICGHPGDGSSEICEICGNPYIDMPDLEDIPTAAETGNQNMGEVVELPENQDIQTEASFEEKETQESADQAADTPELKAEDISASDDTEKYPEQNDLEDHPAKTDDAKDGKAEDIQPAQSGNQASCMPGQNRQETELYDESELKRGRELYGKEREPYAQSFEQRRALYGQSVQNEMTGQNSSLYNQSAQNQASVQDRVLYGQPVQGELTGQGRVPYGQSVQSQPTGQSRVPYGQSVQGELTGQGRVPYGQPAQSQSTGQGRVLYGQSAQGEPTGQGRVLYGQSAQSQSTGQGRIPYGQPQGQPTGQGRVPYGQNGQLQRRRPDDQRGAAGQQPTRAAMRQGMYGQQVMQNARKAFHSPLFLIITILYTAAIAGSVASVFLQELSFSQILQMLTNFDAPNELMTYAEKVVGLLSKIDNGAFVIGMGTKVPEVFMCLGFWIAYLTSGTRRAKMSGAGFVFSKIILVLKMIFSCLVMLGCLLLAVTFVVSAWVSEVQKTKMAAVIFLAALVVITMFVIMYFFCALHTVSVCSHNVKGETGGKVSIFVALLTILIALCSGIALLSAIVNVEIGGIIGNACRIGWMILAGFWIIRYRVKVNKSK